MHADSLHAALLNASVFHPIKFLYFFGLQIDVFETEDSVYKIDGNCHAYSGVGYNLLKL